ncbi:MAG: reverse transcriptase domain-containing protein [Caldilineaceae bacterium]
MFSFHPIIQLNYIEVHNWLSQLTELPAYKLKNAWDKVKRQLQAATLESAALQYYVLFPAHSAKVAFALEQVIGVDRLVEWLKYNSQVTVIDVGCGAGAASVAFVNCLLNLCESGRIQHPMSVHFVGIDPNENAIAIYYQQIARLKPKVEQHGIHITNQRIAEGDLQAVNQLRDHLTKRRNSLGVPFLSHAFLFQANVVSPFSTRYHETELKRQRMATLGIPVEELGNAQEVFGKEEAIAYKQILENAFIDNLHIITVGTEGYEQRVVELAQAIDSEFQGNNHLVEKLQGGEFSSMYQIPDGCYWREFKDNTQWPLKFCVEVSSISNIALADEDWREIKSTKNLQSAWARARHHLLGQTLVDEVEIRLFESKLDDNIARLQQQLVAYAQDVVRTDERLHFRFPKGHDKLRPLGLSRIEEEILSTALIQKLGQRISGITSRSYAYKFSRTYGDYSTEYLYENWFDAYSRYIQDARIAAENNTGCIVIQTDIKSFYTRIIRDNLVQLSTDQLSRSARVEWLLRVLFLRDIDEHEAGQGIVQGNIASGFFANLYLIDLDARFGPNNEWNAKFFRYVDDMIIVVPDPEHVEEVISILRQELTTIGLDLNIEKTEYFCEVSEFIRATDKDEVLDDLQSKFQDWMNCLWILDEQHRKIFRKAYSESQAEWWYRIELYCTCLKSINIIVEATLLSRRIYKYLFNDKLCEKDFSWKQPFEIPSLPENIDENQIYDWKIRFEKANNLWMEEKALFCDSLRELLSKSRAGITKAIALQDARNEKQWTSTFRFCINKLIQIGFQYNEVAQVVVETLIESPWLIRNPHKLTENLAIHGYANLIESLLSHYADETDEMKEYMKSIILRAIRFLPHVPNILWQQIAKSAISSSDITSLMATETWLRVVQNQPELVEENHLQQIEYTLNKDPKPIMRLMKNYLLILGEHGWEIVTSKESDRDLILEDVREIIQANNVDSLFDYYEPEILTREFYSGYRSDHDGYYHPSSP